MLAKYSDVDPFEDFWRGFNLLSPQKTQPPVNILERQGGYEIRMLVPGYSKSDIKISAEAGMLRVSAEKKASDEKPLYKEFSISRFERRFTLPESTNREAIAASCEDGILVVNVPLRNKESMSAFEVKIQ
jgi:HSP20 family protein